MKHNIFHLLLCLIILAGAICVFTSAVELKGNTKLLNSTGTDTASTLNNSTSGNKLNVTTIPSSSPNTTLKIKPTKTVSTTVSKTPKAPIVKNVTTKVKTTKNTTTIPQSRTTNQVSTTAAPSPGTNVNGYFLVTSNVEGAQVSLTDANGLATPVGTISGGQLNIPVDNNASQFKGFIVTAPNYTTFTGSITNYPVNGMTLILESRLNYTGGNRDEYFSVSGDVQGGSTISNVNVITTGAGGCCG